MNISFLYYGPPTTFQSQQSIIIYESTTFPGCTEEICIPIIESISKLRFGKDFDVAYSPERVNPGDKVNVINTITKVIGANDKKTLIKVKNLYQTICKSLYTTPSIKIAESAKVIENIQRDINIALVNELSILFDKSISMIKNSYTSLKLLVLIVIVFNLFAALYYYNYVTGQIEQARLFYKSVYGDDENFNSIFWLCQKIFTGGH